MAEQTRLGDVLTSWIQRQRVTFKHISDVGGVSRNTIDLLRKGTTTEPSAETLRKISRGLATDPYTGDFDRRLYVESLQAFSAAAGMPDLTTDFPPCDLESEIRSIVKDRKRASVFASVLRRYETLTSGQRRMVDSVLDQLDHPE